MKIRTFVFIFLLYFSSGESTVFSQQEPPRLIVRADDMGFSHSANGAIMKTLKEGVATSVEVMIPTPWFPEAVSLLQENPQFDVGVHITLTSEWENMKFSPLTYAPSLTNEDGYFYPRIWPNKNAPGESLSEQDWKIEEIEQELRAQIEMAKRKLPQTSHISAHMGCLGLSPEVEALSKKLAQEYGVDINLFEEKTSRKRYEGPKETSEEKIQSFIKMLETLKPGETYLFVDHPGFNTPELKAIHHAGYEKVAIDRQGVTDAWTDQRVKDTVKRLGIQLISYSDLLK